MLQRHKQRTHTERRQTRVRAKLHGTAQRPRVTVHRSNMHISLQIINDDLGKTLCSATELELGKGKLGTKTERAQKAAKVLAEKAKKLKIGALVFDRGPYKYHGRVQAVANTLRDEGIQV